MLCRHVLCLPRTIQVWGIVYLYIGYAKCLSVDKRTTPHFLFILTTIAELMWENNDKHMKEPYYAKHWEIATKSLWDNALTIGITSLLIILIPLLFYYFFDNNLIAGYYCTIALVPIIITTQWKLSDDIDAWLVYLKGNTAKYLTYYRKGLTLDKYTCYLAVIISIILGLVLYFIDINNTITFAIGCTVIALTYIAGIISFIFLAKGIIGLALSKSVDCNIRKGMRFVSISWGIYLALRLAWMICLLIAIFGNVAPLGIILITTIILYIPIPLFYIIGWIYITKAELPDSI